MNLASDTVSGCAATLQASIASIGCERGNTIRRSDGTRWIGTMQVWPPPGEVLADALSLWEWARQRRPYVTSEQWDWCVRRYDALTRLPSQEEKEVNKLEGFDAATCEDARVTAALEFLGLSDDVFSRSRIRAALQGFDAAAVREALRSLKGEKPENALKWFSARCRKASAELAHTNGSTS